MIHVYFVRSVYNPTLELYYHEAPVPRLHCLVIRRYNRIIVEYEDTSCVLSMSDLTYFINDYTTINRVNDKNIITFMDKDGTVEYELIEEFKVKDYDEMLKFIHVAGL